METDGEARYIASLIESLIFRGKRFLSLLPTCEIKLPVLKVWIISWKNAFVNPSSASGKCPIKRIKQRKSKNNTGMASIRQSPQQKHLEKFHPQTVAPSALPSIITQNPPEQAPQSATRLLAQTAGTPSPSNYNHKQAKEEATHERRSRPKKSGERNTIIHLLYKNALRHSFRVAMHTRAALRFTFKIFVY